MELLEHNFIVRSWKNKQDLGQYMKIIDILQKIVSLLDYNSAIFLIILTNILLG